MKKIFFPFAGVLLVSLLINSSVQGMNKNIFANDETSSFLEEYKGQVDFVQGRILQLENAMPQEKFEWRPADGVRSVAEVYNHIANANMMLLSVMAGTKMEGEMSEKETDKTKIAGALKDSFEKIKEAVLKLNNEELNKVVKTPIGMEMTVRNFMITMLNHMHEHLGQLIAYARMNNVTPPWSMQTGQK